MALVMLQRQPAASSRPFTRSLRPPTSASRRVVVVASQPEQQAAPTNVCSTCGIELSKAEKGCEGGRIIGGMGAIPGFGWWPIKAYRPCPKLDEAGVEYVRKGQATNDVLFGGVSLGKEGVKTLEEMRKTAEKGIKIE